MRKDKEISVIVQILLDPMNAAGKPCLWPSACTHVAAMAPVWRNLGILQEGPNSSPVLPFPKLSLPLKPLHAL
jgi:hypothetical protein